MKNFYLILALTFSFLGKAQCLITGPSSFNVGQTVNYSIPSLAQCADCYDWDINGTDATTAGNVAIVGSDQNNAVAIQGLSAGPFSIKVTYFDETGCHECILSGNVILSGGGSSCCTFKDTDFQFNAVCRGSGPNLGGWLKILKPANCDLSTISKIVVEIGQGEFSATTGFGGQTQAILTPPFTTDQVAIKPTLNFFASPCPSDEATANVTIYYKNGCPTQYFNFSQSLFPNAKTRITEKIKENIFQVSPNPTSSVFKISGLNIENYNVSIYNSFGVEIIKKVKASNEINIENQPKGIYVYKIFDKDQAIEEGKIIKE